MVNKSGGSRSANDQVSGLRRQLDCSENISARTVRDGTFLFVSQRLQGVAILFDSGEMLLMSMSLISNVEEFEPLEGNKYSLSVGKNANGKTEIDIIERLDYYDGKGELLLSNEEEILNEDIFEEIASMLPQFERSVLRHNLRAAFEATQSGVLLPSSEDLPPPTLKLPSVAPELWENRSPDERMVSPAQFIDRVYASYRAHLTFKALEKLDPKLATRYRGWVGSRNQPLPYLPLPRQVRSQKVKAARAVQP